jgi:tetratricopeptide (TPR) repeat protein
VRTLVSTALILFAIARAEPGRAEEPRAAAADHYARGIELASQGLYAGALEQFNGAYTASPHFAVLYNIGQAQMALGRPLEAIEALTKYLRDGAEQVPLSRREQVQAQIGLMESRLAELSITADRVGAIVRVDGRDVGSTPLFQPVRLAAGVHTVTAALPNGPQLTREVPLRESERHSVELTFGIAPQPDVRTPAATVEAPETSSPAGPLLLSPPPVPPAEPWYFRGRTMRRMAYVLTGVGVLSATAAVGVYLANRGQYDDWKTGNAALQNDAPGSAAYMAQATANNARASSLDNANHAIVGLSIAGGVLAAAGVTLFFVDRQHRHETGHLSFGVGDRAANMGWSWTW